MFGQIFVNNQRQMKDITSEVEIHEPKWKQRLREKEEQKKLETLSTATTAVSTLPA